MTTHPAPAETHHEAHSKTCGESCWTAISPPEECECSACGSRNHGRRPEHRTAIIHGREHRLIAVGPIHSLQWDRLTLVVSHALPGPTEAHVIRPASKQQLRAWPELARMPNRGVGTLWTPVARAA